MSAFLKKQNSPGAAPVGGGPGAVPPAAGDVAAVAGVHDARGIGVALAKGGG